VAVLAIAAFIAYRFYEFRRQGPGHGPGPGSPDGYEQPEAQPRPRSPMP
jgi:hypothetical protein